MKRNTVARLHETDESENDTSESDTDSVSLFSPQIPAKKSKQCATKVHEQKKYYQVLCDYLLLKLPLKDPILMHAAVVNTDSPGAKASLDYFLQR